MNPQHTVPVLCDGNLTITESRAAMAYLVSQHKPGQLYPACAKKRSQIDQRLQFGIGTLWARIADCVLPVCLGKTSTIPQEKIDALKEALMWANQMVTLPSSEDKSHKTNSSKMLSNTFHDLLSGGKKKVILPSLSFHLFIHYLQYFPSKPQYNAIFPRSLVDMFWVILSPSLTSTSLPRIPVWRLVAFLTLSRTSHY